MRHGAGKLPRRIARKLCIRVKGDHILHFCEDLDLAHDAHEAILGATAQERIQITKLAALALKTHPDAF